MAFETVHEETRDGFDIKLSLAPEDEAPDWDFESDEGGYYSDMVDAAVTEARETLARLRTP